MGAVGTTMGGTVGKGETNVGKRSALGAMGHEFVIDETARLAEEHAAREAARIPDDAFLSSPHVFWGCLPEDSGGGADGMDVDDDDAAAAASTTAASATAGSKATEDKSSGKTDGKGKASAATVAKPSGKVQFDASSKPPSSPAEGGRESSSTDAAAAGGADGAASSASAVESTALLPAMPVYVPNFLPNFPSEQSSSYGDGDDNANGLRSSSSASVSAIMGQVLLRASRMRGKKRKSPPNGAATSVAVASNKVAPARRGRTGSGGETDNSGRDAVRRSVIELGGTGSSYWGSEWLDDEADGDGSSGVGGGGNRRRRTDPPLPSVPAYASRSDIASGMAKPPPEGSHRQRGGGGNGSSDPSKDVTPLARASGSKFSKILEGSMNIS